MTQKESVELWRLHDGVVEAARALDTAQRRKDEASAAYHDYLRSLETPTRGRPSGSRNKPVNGTLPLQEQAEK